MVRFKYKLLTIHADKDKERLCTIIYFLQLVGVISRRNTPMGLRDTLEKQYLRSNKRFADAFNYFLYDGEQVVDPDKLREIDSTEIATPYGKDGAKSPIQRFRDQIMTWEVLQAMADERTVYVVLGAEAQDKVHYAAPVKDGLYDFMNYAKQVSEASASYRKKGGITDTTQTDAVSANRDDSSSQDDKDGTSQGSATDIGDDGTIRVTSGEFLSGFHKGDHLMPVVTLMVYFGSGEWDGPMSIHEMFLPEIRNDKRLMAAVPDYRLNLLAPGSIPDEDFGKFRSEFGAAMFFLKKQNTGSMEEWIHEFNERFGVVDRQTAELVNTLSNSKLAIEEVEDERGVDMCQAFERSLKNATDKREQETKVIDIKNVMESFGVTVEKAMESLKIPQEKRSIYAGLVKNS